jgi:prepilin-type N-terminal cleavage/methylation domain-containing protein
MFDRIQKRKSFGFTLLEVMVAMSIIAIALTAVLGSQSQSVSLASEAKFNTTAPLLAQSKIGIDLKVSWGEEALYQYRLRLYRFFPKSN